MDSCNFEKVTPVKCRSRGTIRTHQNLSRKLAFWLTLLFSWLLSCSFVLLGCFLLSFTFWWWFLLRCFLVFWNDSNAYTRFRRSKCNRSRTVGNSDTDTAAIQVVKSTKTQWSCPDPCSNTLQLNWSQRFLLLARFHVSDQKQSNTDGNKIVKVSTQIS